jgi:hypothetical protein
MTILVDMRGDRFHEGCKVARAVHSGKIAICTVTRIHNGQIYLDFSKVPINYPRRLLILEKDPLISMMDKYEKTNNLPSV